MKPGAVQSRWQGGSVGAVRAGLDALVDFPPGPRDRPDGNIQIIAELVRDGLLAPTNEFRTGQRVFRITDAGAAEADRERQQR